MKRETFFWQLTVAGEIRELAILINARNKNQEIREHICEITEYFFEHIMINRRIIHN